MKKVVMLLCLVTGVSIAKEKWDGRPRFKDGNIEYWGQKRRCSSFVIKNTSRGGVMIDGPRDVKLLRKGEKIAVGYGEGRNRIVTLNCVVTKKVKREKIECTGNSFECKMMQKAQSKMSPYRIEKVPCKGVVSLDSIKHNVKCKK